MWTQFLDGKFGSWSGHCVPSTNRPFFGRVSFNTSFSAEETQVGVANRKFSHGCCRWPKKRIVRTVIHEVVADIDAEAAEIVLLTHWVGGVHTELRLPRRRRGQRNSTAADIVDAVRQLVLIANDDLIAGTLNRNGLVTGHGNRWTRERVTALRSHHRIPVFRPAPDGSEPWLNLSDAARFLGVAPKTLRLAAEAGEINGIHPLPNGPWIFSRSALGEPPAQRIVQRARQNPRYPAGSHPDQQNLFTPAA